MNFGSLNDGVVNPGRTWQQAWGLLLLLFGICHASASSEQSPGPESWPMFRGGPSLLGIARVNLPKAPALLWTFKTQGPVKSSTAIADGRAFIGSDDGNIYAL